MLPTPEVLSKFIAGVLTKDSYVGCELERPQGGRGPCLTVFAKNLKAVLGPKGQKLEALRVAVQDHFKLQDLEAFASQPGSW